MHSDAIELVRRDFESGKIPKKLLADLYHNYNPSVEIDSFIDEAERLFPALNCGLASVYLQHVIGRGEVVHGSYNDHNHTFLSIGELIIDITADQFGGPKVYIGPLQTPWSLTSA